MAKTKNTILHRWFEEVWNRKSTELVDGTKRVNWFSSERRGSGWRFRPRDTEKIYRPRPFDFGAQNRAKDNIDPVISFFLDLTPSTLTSNGNEVPDKAQLNAARDSMRARNIAQDYLYHRHLPTRPA